MFEFFRKSNKKESLSFQVTDTGLKKVVPESGEIIETEEKPALSLEEELELIETKKSEIENLINQRHDYLVESKNLEEKILAHGVTDEKALEIRKKITDQTGEISKQIMDIRNEYNIQATPVEVYSMRYKMISNEVERITNNMAPEYSKLLLSLNNFFGDTNDSIKNHIINQNGKGISSFKDYLAKDFKENDEVLKFLTNIKDINLYNADNEPQVLDAVLQLKENLKNKIQQETTYKTPGEKRDMQIKLQRLVRLLDNITRELRNAENKEDRFESEQKNHF